MEKPEPSEAAAAASVAKKPAPLLTDTASTSASSVHHKNSHDRNQVDGEDDSEQIAETADDYAAETLEAEEKAPAAESPGQPSGQDEAVYSVFPKKQRVAIIIIGGIAGMFSPMTSAIYLPALTDIANDMGVSTSLINLTITTFQIFQGLAPTFIASFSDVRGRRPAYVVSFVIYLIANLALALQNSYAALMVLRCIQSAGSSATIALGSAIVADVATRAERGRWLGYTTLGISLGPALGPVFGGLLDEYLGWRSIFWFLFITSGVTVLIIIAMFPETGRSVVGNGSVPPKRWNLTLMQWLRLQRGKSLNGGPQVEEDRSTISKPKRRPNPLSALLILLEPEGGITLGFGALLFAGYFMVLTTFSEALVVRFGYSSAIVGLCYLPVGFGGLVSRWTVGRLLDWNFRRHARRLGLSLDMSRQQQIEVFPIERIRLEVCIPLVYISCGTVLAYAWSMETNASLAGILVSLFFVGLFFSGVQQGLNTLVVDTHADIPATATAANNLFRCLVSAGATAMAPFMIKKIGLGFTGLFISGVWFCFTPCLWLVLFRGKKWRDDLKKKQAEKDARDASAKV